MNLRIAKEVEVAGFGDGVNVRSSEGVGFKDEFFGLDVWVNGSVNFKRGII